MIIYTDIEAKENFGSVLDKAKKEGGILIKRTDGSQFIIKPFKKEKSPLEVKGINLKIELDEITSVIREIREKK